MDGVLYSPTGWAVRYSGGDLRLVEQWDPVTGEALVVSPTRKLLVAAGSSDESHELVRVGRIVAAIPAQPGWQLRTREDFDGKPVVSVDPIVGWLVDDMGNMRPVGCEYGASWAGPVDDGYILSPDLRQEDLP